jgi:hypothetical protein
MSRLKCLTWLVVAMELALSGCGGPSPPEDARGVEIAQLQYVVLMLAICTTALWAKGATSRAGGPEAVDHAALGICVVAGAFGAFVTPTAADPDLFTAPLPQDGLGVEPPPEPEGSDTVEPLERGPERRAR